MTSPSNRQQQLVVTLQRGRFVGRQRIEALFKQIWSTKPGQLELAKPFFFVAAPILAQVQCTDKQVAAPFEQQVRRQLDALAIVGDLDRLLTGNGFHQLESGVAHERRRSMLKERWCIAA